MMITNDTATCTQSPNQ